MVILFECDSRDAGLSLETKTIQSYRNAIGDALLNRVQIVPRVVLHNAEVEFQGVRQRLGAWASLLRVPRRVLRERLKTADPEEVFPSIRADIANETQAIREFRRTFSGPHKPVESRFSHDARRERRKQMAEAVVAGESKEAVASRFGVTPTTVAHAVKQFCTPVLAIE
jgi:hypothetical protein